MPKLDSVLPEEQPVKATSSGLPDFWSTDEFTRKITDYIRKKALKWNVPGQLKSLAGSIEAAVPTIEDVIQEIYLETLEGVLKKRTALTGKPEIDYMRFSFAIARNKLASTMTELNSENLTDLKAEIASGLRKAHRSLRNVDRLGHPIDSANDEEEAFTVESKVTDGGALPYDDRNFEEVFEFMTREFEALEGRYPHLGEFHELITGQHDACDARQEEKLLVAKRGKKPLSFSNRQAAAYLNTRYPDHKHDDSTYHRQWVKAMLAVYKEYGYRPTTKPRGRKKNTENHED
jgi:hypothetical protein